MNRREFLEQVGRWTLGSTIAPPLFRILETNASAQPVAEGLRPKVAWAKGEDYAALVSRCLAPLGGMTAFVKPGQTVVVKPNIGWDRAPEHAANTHPVIVASVVKAALDAGARSVQVFDHTCNEPRRCYARSGIRAALDAMNDDRVRLELVDARKFVPIQIAKGQSIQQWDFYKEALQADVYINLPQAKVHSLAKLSLGLKNVMGVIGGNRGDIHRDMGQRLADLATVLKPHLTIIDATRILVRHGPQGGNVEDVKVLDTLVASEDPVAADAYATTLFDMRPEELPSTVAAHTAGLGVMDLAKIELVPA
jgi:uncharacterized protein (DUF362 family)